MRLIATILTTVLLALASGGTRAHAVFEGTWGAGGHYVGAPLLFMFVDAPTAANPHPARSWTDAEKAVIRQSFSEWDRVLCDICFQEIDSNPLPGTITLRWEDDDFFGATNFVAWSHVYGQDLYDFGPDYPQGEIYFNTAMSWYVDADATTDEAFAAMLWDLLTVGTHEIGHMLGLLHQEQDYFDAHPTYAPGVMDNRMGAAGWFEGERRHVTEADWQALTQLDYAVHVAEPAVLPMVVLALALAFVGRRRGAHRTAFAGP